MKQKYALVLSGGGFKGAFQLGALNYLNKNWEQITGSTERMHFDLVAGVSVGALNGALLAQDDLEELNKLWDLIAKNGVEEVYTSDFIKTTPGTEELELKMDLEKLKERFLPEFRVKVNLLKGLGLLFSKKKRNKFLMEMVETAATEVKKHLKGFRSLADNTPLFNKLKQHLDRKKIKDCGFYSGFVSLEDGQYHAVHHDQYTSNLDYVKGVLASSAMPIIWDPIVNIDLKDQKINQSIDGGIRNTAPFGDLIKVINDEAEAGVEYTFIVINCNNGQILPEDYKEASIAKIALRSLNEIAQAEIFNNDLDEFLRINDLLDQANNLLPNVAMKHFNTAKGKRTEKVLKRFRAIVIKPDNGVVGNMLTITPELYQRRKEHGKQKAIEAFADFVETEALMTVREL